MGNGLSIASAPDLLQRCITGTCFQLTRTTLNTEGRETNDVVSEPIADSQDNAC